MQHVASPRRRSPVVAAVLTLTAALAVPVLSVVTVAGPAAAATAAYSPVLQRTSSTVTADALPTVQIDGVVWSQTVVGNTVYAGGKFSKARPAGAAPGTNTTTRNNLLAFDITTGVLNTGFVPSLNGEARAVTRSPDGSRVYVGGTFTTANGQSRQRIAAYSTATGALVSTFAPSLNATVTAITVSSTAVYVAGSFSTANGVARSHLAAFSPSSGALLNWAPQADDLVQALQLTPDGSRVIVGGQYKHINGAAAYGLAATDAVTGAFYAWAAEKVVRDAGSSAAILSLTTDGTAIYSTAYVFGSGGNFEGVLSASPNSGDINWLADCHGDTYSTFGTNGVVYVVSHMHYCSNIGGFPDATPRTWYRATAFTQAATGTVGPNQQLGGGYGDMRGRPSPSLITWLPSLAAGTYTGQSQAAWSLTGDARYIVAGGEFPSVNNVAQQGLVRFAVPSIAPNRMGPKVSASAANPTPVARSSTSVRVGWQTNYDLDDQDLTYAVQRNGATVYSVDATSHPWDRPSIGFLDTGLTPGTTYGYRILARDPSGTVAYSNTVNVTLPTTNPPALGKYVGDVLSAGATHYWRLDQGQGQPNYDAAGYSDLALSSGVTAGATGALTGDSDRASSFSGTSTGYGSTSDGILAPNTFTESAWFATTTTAGGKIVGFGNAASGNSRTYDRHIYMDTSGRIVFGVVNNSRYTLTTPRAYNDGRWHQVVASLSGAGMALYLDGALVASGTGTTIGAPYTGYWRVGGDASWSGSYFAGRIDEVAIFPTALSASQVQQQYVDSASTQTGNQAPTAAFTVSCSQLSCAFDGSGSADPDGSIASYAWAFGDGATGTGVRPSHTYASDGTRTVALTVTDDKGATGTTSRSVTVAASAASASDTFTRTVTGAWGSADVGGAWTVSPATQFSVDGSVGRDNLVTPGGNTGAVLPGVAVTNVNMVVDSSVGAVATGSGVIVALRVRQVGNSDYRLKVRYLSGGVLHLALSRVVSGAETTLGEVVVPLTYAGGDVFRVRFTATGTAPTALAGMMWRVGSAEPASPQITATDSSSGLQGAGAVGFASALTSSVTNAPIMSTYDNLSVTSG